MTLLGLDGSPRTKQISRPAIVTLALMLIIAISIVWMMIGNGRFVSKMRNSSTPVGTELNFSLSDASLQLSGLYTDKDKDVLIARLTPDEQAMQVLPYKGTDYSVLVKSNAIGSKYETVPVLFGQMSTDGDMLLIFPKPTDDVYTFVIVNPDGANAVASVDGTDRSSSAERALGDENQSVTRALSQYATSMNELGADNADVGTAASQSGVTVDLAGFRMTLDPAVKEPQYTPQMIDTDLYDPGTGEFNFEQLYQRVYVDAAVSGLTDEYNAYQTQIAQLEDSYDRLDKRVTANAYDEESARRLDETAQRLKTARDRQQEIADTLTRYQNTKYDPRLFQDFQTEATVVHGDL